MNQKKWLDYLLTQRGLTQLRWRIAQ